MIDLLKKMIDADAQGTQRQLDVLRPGDGDAVELLSHVLASKRVWLARLEGRDTSSMSPFDEWPLEELDAVAAEVRDGWDAYLSRLTDDDVKKDFTYTNTQGQSFTSSVADVIVQVVTHGYHHRGQINRAIRQAGGRPPMIDYIVYHRTMTPAAQ